MSKNATLLASDEIILPESEAEPPFDLSKGVRGKYAGRKLTILPPKEYLKLDADLLEYYSDPEQANDILRWAVKHPELVAQNP